MSSKFKALKQAFLNMINIRSVIDERIKLHSRINEMRTNAKLFQDIGVTDELYNGEEIIITLTTYSKRIYQVHLVIESLLEQTIKPNRIILWLDENEFTHDSLPQNLLLLEKRGLQIEFCTNYRSYKKLIPTLLKYPSAIPITVDDDVIYPEDFIERLYKAYLKDKSKIYFYRGHRMKINNGIILPYKSWLFEYNVKDDSMLNFPTGCGGILYPAGSLDKEVINSKVFMDLCPYADDVWFKAMSIRAGTSCKQIQLECSFRDKFYFIDAMDDIGLANINFIDNKNDEQIKAVFDKYDLYKYLIE